MTRILPCSPLALALGTLLLRAATAQTPKPYNAAARWYCYPPNFLGLNSTYYQDCTAASFAQIGATLTLPAVNASVPYIVLGSDLNIDVQQFSSGIGRTTAITSATFVGPISTVLSIDTSSVSAAGGSMVFVFALGPNQGARDGSEGFDYPAINVTGINTALLAAPGRFPALVPTGPMAVVLVTFAPSSAVPSASFSSSQTVNVTHTVSTNGTLWMCNITVVGNATTFAVNYAAPFSIQAFTLFDTWALSSNLAGANITVQVAGCGVNFGVLGSPPPSPPPHPYPPPSPKGAVILKVSGASPLPWVMLIGVALLTVL